MGLCDGVEGRRGQRGLLDAVSGSERWRASYPCPQYGRFHAGDEGFYTGPSATPTLDAEAGLLYTVSIDGDLNCWQAADGQRVWGLNLYDEFGAQQRPDVGGGLRDYGYTSAPLVHDDWVLVEAGGARGNLVALDRRTGEVAWFSQCKDLAGHSGGPVPIVVGEVPCAVVFTLSRLMVVRLDPEHQGETLASLDWQSYLGHNIPTPVVKDDCIVVTTGFNPVKTARLRVTLDGLEVLWERDNSYAKVGSPVILGDRVYFAWQKLYCLDYETGERVWAEGRYGEDASCLATADDYLIVYGHRVLTLVEGDGRSGGQYREAASVAVPTEATRGRTLPSRTGGWC